MKYDMYDFLIEKFFPVLIIVLCTVFSILGTICLILAMLELGGQL